jgi:mRNA-degrading endonuclease RelE of RelBE toxin-antitoxin system
MKPSELKKDGNFSGRINKKVQKELKKLGISAQEIIDAYINATLKVAVNIEPKHKGK